MKSKNKTKRKNEMKFSIKNYKSIKNLEITLNEDKEHLKILVGKNESGKSNILDAIEELTKESPETDLEKYKNYNAKKDEKLEICLTNNIPKELLKKCKAIGFKDSTIQKCVSFPAENQISLSNEIRTLIRKNLVSKYPDVNDYLEEGEWTPLSELKTKISEYKVIKDEKKVLPFKKDIEKFTNLLEETHKFENLNIAKFSKFKLLERKYSFEEAQDSDVFLSLWSLLDQEEDDIRKLIDYELGTDDFIDLRKKLRKNTELELENFIGVFWTQKTVHFEMEIFDTDFFIRAADRFEKNEKGEFKDINQRSAGMKHYLTLMLFLENEKRKKEKTIILLDEPGNFLHATAVVDLKKYLEKIANENFKIIIATHNPYFVTEDNWYNMNLVEKISPKEGTKIIKNFARLSGKERNSTLTPFLYQIGVDIKSLLRLEGKVVFVEGFHDVILLNALKKHFHKSEDINFFMTCGATKCSTLINVALTINNKMPYFVFDHDEGGKDGLKSKKTNKYVIKSLNNYTYVDGDTEYKEGTKVTTDNLIPGLEKNTKKIIEKAKEIKLADKLSQEIKKNFKLVFQNINKYYE